ncbi:hypothetical protein D3C87_1755240 [compost metagenome]
MGIHLGGDAACREQEHAGIPVVIAGIQHLLGGFQLWLLDETADLVGTAGQGLAHFDIAIAGRGFGRVDAEGNELAGPCGIRAHANAVGVGRVDGNAVV